MPLMYHKPAFNKDHAIEQIKKMLVSHYKKEKVPVPPRAELERQARSYYYQHFEIEQQETLGL